MINNISRWVGGVSGGETRINFWHYTEVIVRMHVLRFPSLSLLKLYLCYTVHSVDMKRRQYTECAHSLTATAPSCKTRHFQCCFSCTAAHLWLQLRRVCCIRRQEVGACIVSLHYQWIAHFYGTPFAVKFRQNIIGVFIQYKIDF